jgi:4-diphosphocytidyl-2-C-methyl-D-erythritol kinase
MIGEFAPAKVNLALHVTGRRADGYHLLDSLVVFASVGDRLEFEPADRDGLTISGRFAGPLSTDAAPGADNLVIRARDALRAWADPKGIPVPAVHIRLKKNLPVASGIGGGSADAAATLRGLDRLWQLGVPRRDLAAIGLGLGADVPMCIESRPLVARGIGEDITFIDDLPALFLLLVNPMVEVSTPSVFRALLKRDNPPLDLPGEGAPLEQWLGTLAVSRNDLQPAAETDVRADVRFRRDMLRRLSQQGWIGSRLGETRGQAAGMVSRRRVHLRDVRPCRGMKETEGCSVTGYSSRSVPRATRLQWRVANDPASDQRLPDRGAGSL